MKRNENGDFPRLPQNCRRHRPVEEVDLETDVPTGRVRCWHCGAVLEEGVNPDAA